MKVMQSLYSLSTLESGDKKDQGKASRLLDSKLDQVLDIFTACVLLLIDVAEYARTDAEKRASRYLKVDADKNVNTDISNNAFVQKILKNASLMQKAEKDKIRQKYIQEDWAKEIFNNLIKSEEYQTYIHTETHNATSEKAIIYFIWKTLIFDNEGIQEYFNDEMPGWEDDRELIGMLMDNFFSKNTKVDFSDLLSAEKKEYAHDLIRSVIDKDDFCMGLIEPKLNNWDKERIAQIDRLLLRMGVCELLYFPTIPTKVTINEYIDIAKQYSTPQSGQFVNGVLDNILKDLTKENRIEKTDRNTKS